jgi:hypothetical protein
MLLALPAGMSNLRLWLSAILACAACTYTPSGTVPTGSPVRVANQSDFVLTELHVAPVNQFNFGPNLFAQSLAPGAAVTIDLGCDVLDVLIRDQQGGVCTLTGLDLCANSGIFVIRNATCSVFGNQ